MRLGTTVRFEIPVSYRILRWRGGEQDGSRMIAACETCACLHWVWGHSQENFKFTSASDAIWDKLSEQNLRIHMYVQ